MKKKFEAVIMVMLGIALAMEAQVPENLSGSNPGPVISESSSPQTPTPYIPRGTGPVMVPGMPSTPLAPGFPAHPLAQLSWAVNDHDFALLVEAINNQTFASNQLPMIQAAGLCGYFTCSQCAVLMGIFDFDSNKLEVVRYLAPHLIDPIRCQPIMDQLSFISDQKKAWNIISEANL